MIVYIVTNIEDGTPDNVYAKREDAESRLFELKEYLGEELFYIKEWEVI